MLKKIRIPNLGIRKALSVPTITLGCTLVGTLSLMTLATTTVLSMRSPTPSTVVGISEESISGKNESLEIRVMVKGERELLLKVTGKSTMVVVLSLIEMLNGSVEMYLPEESSPSTEL